MTGIWWLDLLLGTVGGIALMWLVLIAALTIFLLRKGMLREALRLLPDLLRLLRRLAADPTLPRGVRIRIALLLGLPKGQAAG